MTALLALVAGESTIILQALKFLQSAVFVPGRGRPPDSPHVEVPMYGPPPGDVGDSSDGGEDGAELWHNQDKDYQNGVVVGVRRLKFFLLNYVSQFWYLPPAGNALMS